MSVFPKFQLDICCTFIFVGCHDVIDLTELSFSAHPFLYGWAYVRVGVNISDFKLKRMDIILVRYLNIRRYTRVCEFQLTKRERHGLQPTHKHST